MLDHTTTALKVVAAAIAALAAVPAIAPARAPDAERAAATQTVRVRWATAPDSFDPARTYLAAALQIHDMLHRPLYAVSTSGAEAPQPDLAASAPEIAADGRSVVVHVRTGVHFAPPVNREVTAADVKYAIERGFFKTVQSPYAGTYFGDIVGAKADVAPGTTIPGITTPDASTIVFRLAHDTGAGLAAALVMEITAPVPPEVAGPQDAHTKGSTYGDHPVSSGPYQIVTRTENTLVVERNPNWDPATDIRVAAVGRFAFRFNLTHGAKESRQVVTGRRTLGGDLSMGESVFRSLRKRFGAQVMLADLGATGFVALSTKRPPLNKVLVRRAIGSALDRRALREVTGGSLSGPIATHYLSPSTPGFADAGAMKGTGSEDLSSPGGNVTRGRRLLRQAGVNPHRFTLTLATIDDDTGNASTKTVARNLRSLGFHTRIIYAKPQTIQGVCGRVHVCPTAGWLRDFADGQAVLDPLFYTSTLPLDVTPNTFRLSDSRLDRLIEQARAEAVGSPGTELEFAL